MDWIGGRSLMAALDLRLSVEAATDTDSHDGLRISAEGAVSSEVVLRDSQILPFGHPLRIAGICLHGLGVRSGHISIKSDVPPAAGLASSATLVVALVEALGPATLGKGESIVRAAWDLEHVVAGRDVGVMDYVPVVYGGVVLVDTLAPAEQLIRRLAYWPPDTAVVIVDTLQERDTSTVINGKRARFERREAGVQRYATEIGRVVDSQLDVLESRGSGPELGAQLLEAHALLRDAMRVSTPTIDNCVDMFLAAGAYGAKLTGTGLGGSVVGLMPSCKVISATAAFAGQPVRVYPTSIAHVGVTVL